MIVAVLVNARHEVGANVCLSSSALGKEQAQTTKTTTTERTKKRKKTELRAFPPGEVGVFPGTFP